jgi:hypothetical protein
VPRISPVVWSVIVTVVSSVRMRTAFPGVVVADAEVVELAGSAEGEFAESVDDVVSDPVVGGEGFAVGGGFDGGCVGLCGGLASEGAVGSLLVVGDPELVELGLQVGGCCGQGSGLRASV